MTCFLLCLFHFCYLRLKKRTDELFLISWFPLPLLLFSLSRWRHVKCYNLRLIMYSSCVSDPFHGVLRNPKVWGSIPYGNLFFLSHARDKTKNIFLSDLFTLFATQWLRGQSPYYGSLLKLLLECWHKVTSFFEKTFLWESRFLCKDFCACNFWSCLSLHFLLSIGRNIGQDGGRACAFRP